MMKLAITLFAVIFAAAAENDFPIPYPPSDHKDGNTAMVPDVNGELSEVIVDEVLSGDFPYFPIKTAVRFELYTRDNPDEPQMLSAQNNSLAATNYNSSRPTRMFIHGWNSLGTLTPLFTSAYFKKANHDVNLIAVNWRDGADTAIYPNARRRVNRVGPFVAQFIDFLVYRADLVLADFVLVGHSLGAHVAGIAGKNVVSGKIGKIVGLDPAGPLFNYNDADTRLSSTDAEYVETIHTNAGTLGMSQPLGHASFYPNGGSKQPGCGWDLVGACAHGRSYMYYTESIHHSEQYLGVKCESLFDMQRGRCHVDNETDTVVMGGENPNGKPRKEGVFYFETNPTPNFSIGRKIVNGRKFRMFY